MNAVGELISSHVWFPGSVWGTLLGGSASTAAVNRLEAAPIERFQAALGIEDAKEASRNICQQHQSLSSP